MKALTIILAWAYLFFSAGGPELSFVGKRIINYGPVSEGDVADAKFRIKNTGEGELLIITTIATCNCTSVKYPRHSLKSGEEADIVVTIDTKGKHGPETIVVRLLTNTDEKYSVIKVDIDVQEKSNESTTLKH